MNAYNKQYGYNQLLLHSANNACAMYIFSLTRARCVFKTPCVFFEKIHCKDMKFPKFSTICFRKKFDFLRFFDFSSFFFAKTSRNQRCIRTFPTPKPHYFRCSFETATHEYGEQTKTASTHHSKPRTKKRNRQQHAKSGFRRAPQPASPQHMTHLI